MGKESERRHRSERVSDVGDLCCVKLQSILWNCWCGKGIFQGDKVGRALAHVVTRRQQAFEIDIVGSGAVDFSIRLGCYDIAFVILRYIVDIESTFVGTHIKRACVIVDTVQRKIDSDCGVADACESFRNGQKVGAILRDAVLENDNRPATARL